MKELGEYLKEVRESNGVGIQEASEDLKISENVLQNVERGNSKAFRDMLELKELVKNYAKYLGLDPEKIIDEFNDFLFEHTSKISLSDILEAEKNSKEKQENKVRSPYTQPKQLCLDIRYKKLVGLLLLIGLFLVVFVIVLKAILIKDVEIVNKELRGDKYEYAKQINCC